VVGCFSKLHQNQEFKVLIGSYDDFGLGRMFESSNGWPGSISAPITTGWYFEGLKIS